MRSAIERLRSDRVLALHKASAGLPIWIVGDVMVDEYIEGSVGRVSPEAPVPVVHVERSYSRLGGAANVAHGASVLGADVSLCGAIGEDRAADTVLTLCADAGIDVRSVARLPNRPTTRKLRVMARHQQMLRLDWEMTTPPTGASMLDAISRLESGPPPRAVVVSDYAKGLLSADVLARVFSLARVANAPIVVDPKGRDFARYAGAALVTPNIAELETASGEALGRANPDTIEAAAHLLLERVDVGAILVTMGERGMMLVPRVGETVTIPTLAREVFDVTGAGDTVVAALAVAVAAGWNLSDAARFANAAAGVVVGKVGTSTARWSEIAGVLTMQSQDKLFDRAELSEQIAWWKLQGKRIVFTNGCYDLLHAGHISLLQEAAKAGDVLVLGLNSDASVGRLKGQGRPVVAERDRARILGALECVDAITVFDEDTPVELLRELRPDVLVKGADYAIDQVVGRDIVEAYGGTVVIIPIVRELSSSTLVEQIRNSHG
jgi:D-beta-D-heptose 7-phosphate kinase/D-beta-D-heptose 1-phosphate adenosyltransferase